MTIGAVAKLEEIESYLDAPSEHSNNVVTGFSDRFLIRSIKNTISEQNHAILIQSAVLDNVLEYSRTNKKLPITQIWLDLIDRSARFVLFNGVMHITLSNISLDDLAATSFDIHVLVTNTNIATYVNNVIDNQLLSYAICYLSCVKYDDVSAAVATRAGISVVYADSDGSQYITVDDNARKSDKPAVKPRPAFIEHKYPVEFVCSQDKKWYSGILYPYKSTFTRSMTTVNGDTSPLVFYIAGDCIFESDDGIFIVDVQGYVKPETSSLGEYNTVSGRVKCVLGESAVRGDSGIRLNHPDSILFQNIDIEKDMHSIVTANIDYLLDVTVLRLALFAYTSEIKLELYTATFCLDRHTLDIIKVSHNVRPYGQYADLYDVTWKQHGTPNDFTSYLTLLVKAFAKKWIRANLFDDVPYDKLLSINT